MSIDTVFRPMLPTILVVGSGARVVPVGTPNVGTQMVVRVVNLSATAQRLGYGTTAALALTNATAPTAAPGVQALTLAAGGITFLEFSTGTFFAADNGTGFELTPGNC